MNKKIKYALLSVSFGVVSVIGFYGGVEEIVHGIARSSYSQSLFGVALLLFGGFGNFIAFLDFFKKLRNTETADIKNTWNR